MQLSNGFVGDLSFTPDGQSLAYLSSADDLTANPTPPISDTAPASGNPSPLPNAPPTPPANLFLTNLSTGVDDARQRHAHRHALLGQRRLLHPQP